MGLEICRQLVSGFTFLCLCLVIHRLMPALLKTLKNKKDLVSNEIYLLSAVTALLKVAETLPHFLSPYLLDCLLQVSSLNSYRYVKGDKICPVPRRR